MQIFSRVMSHPVTRPYCISIQSFSGSSLLLSLHSSTPEANDLFSRVRGHLRDALSLFYTAPTQFPSQAVYASLLHECARYGDLEQGRRLHQHMLLAGKPCSRPDTFVTNHLINMYAKCGDLKYAHELFDEMPRRNVISWTALISGYAQRGFGDECFSLFSRMLMQCRPNEFALASVLSSCRYVHGTQVHGFAVKMALYTSVYVANALVILYGKSSRSGGADDGGAADNAWAVFEAMEFRNLISWNSMVEAFQFCKVGTRAIELFIVMHREGTGFDRATLLSISSALCGSNDIGVDSGLKFCLQLHSLIVKTGFSKEVEVATALVKAYSFLGGDVADCYRLFTETSCRGDIISWTGIITAFAEQNPEKAMFLFCQLQREGLAPDWYTFSIVLKACAGHVTELHASAVHSQVIKYGFEGDTVLQNALIHAYFRCGSIDLSTQVFDEMESRDVVSWNSMLKGYALHGRAKDALLLFSRMDVKPDPTTFVSLLSACSHSGMVKEAIKIFDSMFENHEVFPQLDHYACLVDALGRAGRVLEAEQLIKKMPMEADSVIWSALLGSCRKHGETELARIAADKLKELEPENSLSYVQMSNIYCVGGNFDKAGQARKEMKGSKVKKEPGLSWIEISNHVHEFASGGRHHPLKEAICTKLEKLIGQLKEMGYVPETNLALHDIEEEHKEEQLLYHSEKLALAFALMNEGNLHSHKGSIRIMKNIRICVDCHNFMKLASDLLRKEIVVRDSNRFHHFKDRLCSCNDYW